MPPKKLRSKRSFEGEEEGQVSSMPRDELAKVLNYFRYHGGTSKSTTTALKDDCLAVKSAYPPTGNLSSCFFYSGGVNFLMQLQFLAPVELFFKQLKGYSF